MALGSNIEGSPLQDDLVHGAGFAPSSRREVAGCESEVSTRRGAIANADRVFRRGCQARATRYDGRATIPIEQA